MREFSGIRSLPILAVAAAGILIAGCDSPPTACTEEFVSYTVQVLSPEGDPADSVAIGVRNADTETDYNVCADNLCRQDRENGHYIIFHDGLEVHQETTSWSPVRRTVLRSGPTTFFDRESATYVRRAGQNRSR